MNCFLMIKVFENRPIAEKAVFHFRRGGEAWDVTGYGLPLFV